MPLIRKALLDDVDALLEIEKICFDTDRLTRRNFRWMINKAKADLFVAEEATSLIGYILILFHKGTSLARIYSLAVLPDNRSSGIAHKLMERAEQAAIDHDCVTVRLEVRPDNSGAIRFYEKHGYQFFTLKPNFYEDNTEALRYQKRVLFPQNAQEQTIPHYRQTTEFTCGPACLIMAMLAHKADIETGPTLELQIWREATTIFMTSGHGGCSAHGLALSAYQRGHKVRLFVQSTQTPFIRSVRDERKKQVLELVHADFTKRIAAAGIAEEPFPQDLSLIEDMMAAGGVVMILVSLYRLTGDKAPHWLVISRIDSRFVYVNDPDVDYEEGKSETDCVDVPIRREDFQKMAHYGRSQLRSMVVVF